MKENVPWKKNAESVLVVYTILAAIGGILIIFLLTDPTTFHDYWWLILIPLVFAVFLFIYSAEQITDALDEDDVQKMLYIFLLYNIAVVLLIFGLIAIIYFKISTSIPLCGWKNLIALLICIGSFLIFSLHWLKHINWLLFKDEQTYHHYIHELKGEIKPKYDHEHSLIKVFFWIRKKWAKKNLPIEFKKLNIELKSSPINGIGVFATRDFEIEEYIAEGIHKEDYSKIIKWDSIKDEDESIKKKILDFCIGTPEGFFPPEDLDFNQLSVEWYMNHSCNGNVGFNKNGDFIALHSIKKGDELTYDYGLVESNPNFKINCDCKSENCRKIITGNDWKNEKFREEFRNFMLPSLKDK